MPRGRVDRRTHPEQQEQLAGLLRILLQDTQRKLGDDRIGHVAED
ncbi:hypothetical protein ACFW1M_18445 [Streptomyces inhibens]